ncbi:MAG: BamA/TamA family outer membrane protein [Leptolyngbyaceae cyanobacterium MO_188.B28]|nr:BamA/TamA family outer membrane protein [Leptolyngbyaceae cyanobacterium MO_188.B28]
MSTNRLLVSRRSLRIACLITSTLGISSTNFLFAVAGWGQTTPSVESSQNDASMLMHGSPYSTQMSLSKEAQPLQSTVTFANPFKDGNASSSALTVEGVSTQAQDLMPASQPVVELGFQEFPISPITEVELAQRSEDSNRSGFEFYIGSELPSTTALQGPTRSSTVPAANDVRSGFNLSGGAQYWFDDHQRVVLELRGGASVLGGDLSYIYEAGDPGWGFSVNVFNQRAFSSSFREGERDVDLPNGEAPWVHRLGGGVEGFYRFAPDWDAALGVTYQLVSVRDDPFTSDLEPLDEENNRLTVSDDGQDELLTINLAAQYDTRDSSRNPTEGSRVRVGLDQSIPVGEADISMTRLSASASQFIPLSLFGFTEGPRTLVLNVQGGHIFGDVPPYQAFNLGGTSSLRGFSRGEAATGRSFLQATAEYRFPIADFIAFDEDVNVGGTLFVDYADALGTQDEVIGDPGVVRDKDGEGFGFGVGLRVNLGASTGPLRLELGVTDDGDTQVHFAFGERF